MANRTEEEPVDGVRLSYGADKDLYTARDVETGVASSGHSRAEALAMLAEALELHEGGGQPVTDDDLRELGLGPEDFDGKPLPDFLQ